MLFHIDAHETKKKKWLMRSGDYLFMALMLT